MLERARRIRWRDDHSGQAMIEMALLLPFVFLLILMIIEMGFLLWTNLNVNQAAREAARYASVGLVVGDSDDDDCVGTNSIRGRAYEAAVGRITCEEVEVVYVERRAPSPAIGRGDGVVVTIRHPYESLTGFFRLIGGTTSFDVVACADARVETPPDPGDASVYLGNAGCT